MDAWTFCDGRLGPLQIQLRDETESDWDKTRVSNGFTEMAGSYGASDYPSFGVEVHRDPEARTGFAYVAVVNQHDTWEPIFLETFPDLVAFLRYVMPVVSVAISDDQLDLSRAGRAK